MMDNHNNIIENLARDNNFEVQHRIGAGSFSSVFSAVGLSKKQVFAVKVTKLINDLEAETWPKILHPNIIPVWEILYCSSKTFIAYKIPFCLGSMAALIQSSQLCAAKDGFQRVCQWTYQISCALLYLHDHSLRHLDIKLDNILLSQKQNALLSDFSFLSNSKYLPKTSIRSMHCRWKPPELWNSEPDSLHDTEKLDLWCLGIASIEMFTRNALLRKIRSVGSVQHVYNLTETFILSLGDVANLHQLVCSAFPASYVDDNSIRQSQESLSLFLQMVPQQRKPVSSYIEHVTLHSGKSAKSKTNINQQKPLKSFYSL